MNRLIARFPQLRCLRRSCRMCRMCHIWQATVARAAIGTTAALIATALVTAFAPAASAFTSAVPAKPAHESYKSYESETEALYRRSLPDTRGVPQPLSQHRGKLIVVNFWASWCAPCVQEMPELSKLQNEYADKGVTLVGIGVDSKKNISRFFTQTQLPARYPIYVAGFEGTDLARPFGNSAGALPFTIVIDKKGRVRYTQLGKINVAILRATLDALLAENKPIR